jgi:alkylhydroperoxidase/carboxymuconolactone decarboxylase family protein YurZ
MTETIRLRPGALEWREVEGEIVALDLRASTYFAVNATGAAIWGALTAGATREELVSQLQQAFAVDANTAASDLDAFLTSLRENDLLED